MALYVPSTKNYNWLVDAPVLHWFVLLQAPIKDDESHSPSTGGISREVIGKGMKADTIRGLCPKSVRRADLKNWIRY